MHEKYQPLIIVKFILVNFEVGFVEFFFIIYAIKIIKIGTPIDIHMGLFVP